MVFWSFILIFYFVCDRSESDFLLLSYLNDNLTEYTVLGHILFSASTLLSSGI